MLVSVVIMKLNALLEFSYYMISDTISEESNKTTRFRNVKIDKNVISVSHKVQFYV